MSGGRRGSTRHEYLADPLDREKKQHEWWNLLRTVVPLMGAGIGVSWLYASLAMGEEGVRRFWIGVPLAVLGTVCTAIGYRGRLREIRSPRPPTGRHYWWLLVGGALILAGVLIPPYSLA